MTSSSALSSAQPQSTKAESEARATFQSLIWALSNPGRIFTLPGIIFSTNKSCQQIGAALLDLETSFYTADHLLRRELEHTGAYFRTISSADYLFFPDYRVFDPLMLRQTLDQISQARTGSLTDPDQSATLIVACLLGAGRKLSLRGPGIRDQISLVVDDLPIEFWQLRNQKINYPLGFDLFLVDGDQVVGLPRTTIVEVS